MAATNVHEVLTAEQAANILGLKAQTLAVWRLTGRHGLPFHKVGKVVRYHRRDIDEWLAGRRGTSNAQITKALALA